MDDPDIQVTGDTMIVRFTGRFGPTLKDPDPFDLAVQRVLKRLKTARPSQVVVDVAGVAGRPDSAHVGSLLLIDTAMAAMNSKTRVVLSRDQQDMWENVAKLDNAIPSHLSVEEALDAIDEAH